MFGLSKKIGQAKENSETLSNNNSNSNEFSSGEDNLINGGSVINNEPNVLKDNVPEWEKNLNWADDISWSKVLISNSENLRQSGTINRQKDTAMVVLVRRLEYFPDVDTVISVRGLFEKELNRLNSVKEAMKFGEDETGEQNPILTQTGIELASELNKINIEQEAFEKKVSGETQIINDLVNSIILNGKPRDLVVSLLHLYNFEVDSQGIIYHSSSPTDVKMLEEAESDKLLTMEAEHKLLIDSQVESNEREESENSNEIHNEYINSTLAGEIANLQPDITLNPFGGESRVDLDPKPQSKRPKTRETIQNISQSISEKGSESSDNEPFSYIFASNPEIELDKNSSRISKFKHVKINSSVDQFFPGSSSTLNSTVSTSDEDY